MPLTFLGFEHLIAGANQAIYATQPLVLYMLTPEGVYPEFLEFHVKTPEFRVFFKLRRSFVLTPFRLKWLHMKAQILSFLVH
jgi:hypothetical protein